MAFSIKGAIGFRPYTKPTAQKLPLTWESQHAPEVAWGWPLAEVSRLHRLSCNYAEFQAALRSKLAFFELNFMHKSIVQLAREQEPHSSVQPKSDGTSRQKSVWLVVPYHNVVYRSVKNVIHNHTRNWLQRGLQLDFRPRVSWSKAGRTVAEIASALLPKGGD